MGLLLANTGVRRGMIYGREFRKKWQKIESILLHTPWSRVLLEKLTGSQLVKKFPSFYGTRRFITAFTSACHLSLSWASSIHSILPLPSSWRSIVLLSSPYVWVIQVVSFPQVSPPNSCTCLSSPPYVLHALPISWKKYRTRIINPNLLAVFFQYPQLCSEN